MSALEEQRAIEPWAGSDEHNSVVPKGLDIQPGEITSRSECPGVGAVELELSNGMRVRAACPGS